MSSIESMLLAQPDLLAASVLDEAALQDALDLEDITSDYRKLMMLAKNLYSISRLFMRASASAGRDRERLLTLLKTSIESLRQQPAGPAMYGEFLADMEGALHHSDVAHVLGEVKKTMLYQFFESEKSFSFSSPNFAVQFSSPSCPACPRHSSEIASNGILMLFIFGDLIFSPFAEGSSRAHAPRRILLARYWTRSL